MPSFVKIGSGVLGDNDHNNVDNDNFEDTDILYLERDHVVNDHRLSEDVGRIFRICEFRVEIETKVPVVVDLLVTNHHVLTTTSRCTLNTSEICITDEQIHD